MEKRKQREGHESFRIQLDIRFDVPTGALKPEAIDGAVVDCVADEAVKHLFPREKWSSDFHVFIGHTKFNLLNETIAQEVRTRTKRPR